MENSKQHDAGDAAVEQTLKAARTASYYATTISREKHYTPSQTDLVNAVALGTICAKSALKAL